MVFAFCSCAKKEDLYSKKTEKLSAQSEKIEKDVSMPKKEIKPEESWEEKLNSLKTSLDPQKRIEAIKYLAEDGEVDEIGDMLIFDIDPKVRKAAAVALQNLRNPKVIPKLLQATKSENNNSVKKEILWAITETDSPEAIKAAIKLIDSSDPVIRMGAVQILADQGDKSVLKYLENLKNDPVPEIRKKAEKAIEVIKKYREK